MLFSCQGKKSVEEVNLETTITQQCDTLTMVYTKNGRKDYRFLTPLMERYELARDPYMEFRYGVNIITFDSLGGDASSLRADYAIYYEKRELWEARGNVVATGEGGRTLYTQQLFWDQKTDKVYSNVDCKVVDGDDVIVGEGFESDSQFHNWVIRENEGRLWVDTEEAQGDAPKPKAKPAPKPAPKPSPKPAAVPDIMGDRNPLPDVMAPDETFAPHRRGDPMQTPRNREEERRAKPLRR